MGTKSTNIKCVQRQKSHLHTHSVCTKTTNGTKIEYKKLPPISQIVIWLLAFCVLAAFSLYPLAGLATQRNITAGGPSDNTFYINAPVYVAGDSGRNENTGSADTSGVLKDSAKDKALFKTDGTINIEVLADLLNMLDDSKVTENSITDNTNSGIIYYSAKNFGRYGNQISWEDAQKGNSQILVKLFETTTDSLDAINAFTSQYWQAVYRSINGENDVLTLYMCCPYTTAQFNPDEDTTYNGKTYRYEGNYSQSYLRDKTVLPLYDTLEKTYSELDKYVVAPNAIPGLWQSSAYQTSSNSSGATGGTGSSGYSNGSTNYGLNNGLDGQGTKHTSWSGTIESNYTDKLWVPSGFEVLHTGYQPTSGATLTKYDGENSVVYLSNYDSASSATPSNSNTNENRTGLWELNGYDRTVGSNYQVWLRSGTSSYLNSARVISLGGNAFHTHIVSDNLGVRPALHLNLGTLKSLLPTETNLQITATNNVPNSLLILTIMDGSTQIAEYSCISGASESLSMVSINLKLPFLKKYKLLATRPFGSSLIAELNGQSLSPTNFACYIITTKTAQMNLTFTLSGDRSSNNMVVI